MTLADAIRLGAMTSEQVYGGVMEEGQGRCALSAAADACGIHPTCGNNPLGHKVGITPYVQLERLFPVLGRKVMVPWGGEQHPAQTVEVIITTLNDTYGWTRERIADWVESIENKLKNPEIQTHHATTVMR